MYEKIKRWYHLGLWTEAQVLEAVEKNVISEEEAVEILSGGIL